MHSRLIPNRKSHLAVGSLVVLGLIVALSRLSDANPDRPVQAGKSVLFDGSQILTKPERRRRTSRSERTESRVQRHATALLREAMSLPQEIPTSRDFRMYEVHGERLVFPRHGYERMYLQGWNECLYVVGNTNADVQGDIRSSCLMSFKDAWASGAGLVAGFDDCQRRIVSLTRIYNLDLIRNLAKELHREIPGGVAWERKKFTGTDRSRDRLNVGKEGEKDEKGSELFMDEKGTGLEKTKGHH